jgi:RNA polymerase sigma-70 factor (ECF subfamily)
MSQGQPSGWRGWVLSAVERYQQPLLRYAVRLVGDPDAARDAVQHAFLRLCECDPQTVQGREGPWLFRVCRNKALDRLRSLRRTTTADPAEWPADDRRQTDPTTEVERHDLASAIRGLLAALPENQRDALNLWCEGCTYREIAEILETTEGNVRVLMHRALRHLRNHPLVRALAATEPAAATGDAVDAAAPGAARFAR